MQIQRKGVNDMAKKRGRPRQEITKSYWIHTRVEQDLRQQLLVASKQCGLTQAELIRQGLLQVLNDNTTKGE